MTAITRDFIIALNYAFEHGICKPEDMPKAEKEFGKFADKVLPPKNTIICESCGKVIDNPKTCKLDIGFGEKYYRHNECN